MTPSLILVAMTAHCLEAFQSQTKDKLNLYNVDASTSFKESNEAKGITYVNDYFNKDTDVPKADHYYFNQCFSAHTRC